jgi:hypothetical protein
VPLRKSRIVVLIVVELPLWFTRQAQGRASRSGSMRADRRRLTRRPIPGIRSPAPSRAARTNTRPIAWTNHRALATSAPSSSCSMWLPHTQAFRDSRLPSHTPWQRDEALKPKDWREAYAGETASGRVCSETGLDVGLGSEESQRKCRGQYERALACRLNRIAACCSGSRAVLASNSLWSDRDWDCEVPQHSEPGRSAMP